MGGLVCNPRVGCVARSVGLHALSQLLCKQSALHHVNGCAIGAAGHAVKARLRIAAGIHMGKKLRHGKRSAPGEEDDSYVTLCGFNGHLHRLGCLDGLR